MFYIFIDQHYNHDFSVAEMRQFIFLFDILVPRTNFDK